MFFGLLFEKDKPCLANELYYTALIKRQKRFNRKVIKIPDLHHYIWYLLLHRREIAYKICSNHAWFIFYSITHTSNPRYRHQNHHSRFNRPEVMRHTANKPELAAIFDFWHTRIFEASMFQFQLIPHIILALVQQ